MSRELHIEQNPLLGVGHVSVTELAIQRAPNIRRASADFAYQMGGPILQQFLDIACRLDVVRHNSLVMSQPTNFRTGTTAALQHWHFDFTPGTELSTDESFVQAIYGNIGLIACAFEPSKHPRDTGTIFLQEGNLILDMAKRNRSLEYVPGQYLDPKITSGRVDWWHPLFQEQVEHSPDLAPVPLLPNIVYQYGSHNVHRAPVMQSNQGQRLIMRINTPTNRAEKSSVENIFIPQTDPRHPTHVIRDMGAGAWTREDTRTKKSDT